MSEWVRGKEEVLKGEKEKIKVKRRGRRGIKGWNGMQS